MSPEEEVIRLVRENKIDTIITMNLFPAFFCLKAIKQFPDLNLIVHYHTTIPSNFKELLQAHFYFSRFPKKVEIIPICNNQKEYVARKYSVSLSRFKETIYNGIDTAYWNTMPLDFDRRRAKEELGIPPEASIVLNVATIKKNKRHDIMIRALRENTTVRIV